MRFISKIRKYQICWKKDITAHFATGESSEIQAMRNCEFDLWGSLNQWEVEAANDRFINTGLNLELDGHTTIDAMDRYSVFDTNRAQEEWDLTDEERLELEDFLQSEQKTRGGYGTYFIRVDAPALAPPWPTYDSFRGVRGAPTGARIAERVLEDGYDVERVLAYERANANRFDVIEALEAIGTEPVEDELIVLA